MKEEIETSKLAIENLHNEGRLSLDFKNELIAAIEKAAINTISKRHPGGIDPRTIKCGCGKKECKTGLSFDSDDEVLVLRFHFLEEEVHMKLNEKERNQLIEELNADY